MNTSVKDLAALMATAIWADGEFDEAEKIVLGTIAEAFEIEEESLQKEVDASLAEVQSMNEDEVNDYLLSHSAEIEDEEAEMIFEALLEIVLCDGELSSEEVDNLMAMASAMGIDDSRAILMLADMVKEEDCVVQFSSK